MPEQHGSDPERQDPPAPTEAETEPESEAERGVTFAGLELRPELVAALSHLGYEEPTPIQREAIPVLLAGRDVLGQAATGTGKTAAFALPILERLAPGKRDRDPVALILVPTRELAMQVSEALHRYGRDLGVRVLPIYGGQPIGRQLQSLDRGVDVVVATPGRAIDHLNRRTLRLGALQVMVLDEADEMLDMGFAEDLEAIFAATPESRQTVLFSATLPSRIDAIARTHLHDPVRIRIAESSTAEGEAPRVRHSAYVVQRPYKAAALGRILDVEAPTAALVFCRTRDQVDHLTETLNGRGYRAEALHGGMSQEQRDRVMQRLRNGTADLLIATDVAARGLDIDLLSHVVNYDVPASVESYVHRMGRVGRAGREGVAITLAEPREHRMLKTIERATKRRIEIEKVPTVADLQARRLELTRAALQESILGEDLDHFRVVVESLASEFDVMEIALAAVKLAHEASGAPADEQDIPDVTPFNKPDRGARFERDERPERAGQGGSGGRGANRREPASGMTRLFVGIGRDAGMRPQDLVGAITGETQLQGKQIGAIDIAPRFSLVEVPDAVADDVINALRDSKIRGKKATVRRERF
ncbi:DEAD/DEAH box helicase [Acidiferrimicrobium sp. IK]|uniref:DEAD/DEAH box helicase n=1 Tax=Acidiferrimicrobium sp. IK TaxID=2871700 RepID=UPI0039670109